MEYWHDIIRTYDDTGIKEPNKKDDGTYSQTNVVAILIYLAYGKDYPYHIAKMFEKMPDTWLKQTARSGTLKHTGKIGTLLNRMEQDGLVVVTENTVKNKIRKYYKINPAIIQSPVRDGIFLNRDCSAFEIPLGLVERFLAWLEESNKEDSRRKALFQNSSFSGCLNYATFLHLLRYWAWDWEKPDLAVESGNQEPTKPTLFQLVKEYINESGRYMDVDSRGEPEKPGYEIHTYGFSVM